MANMWQQLRRFWCALFTREVMDFRADRGRRGEDAALCLLKGMGFSLVARNARIGGGFGCRLARRGAGGCDLLDGRVVHTRIIRALSGRSINHRVEQFVRV